MMLFQKQIQPHTQSQSLEKVQRMERFLCQVDSAIRTVQDYLESNARGDDTETQEDENITATTSLELVCLASRALKKVAGFEDCLMVAQNRVQTFSSQYSQHCVDNNFPETKELLDECVNYMLRTLSGKRVPSLPMCTTTPHDAETANEVLQNVMVGYHRVQAIDDSTRENLEEVHEQHDSEIERAKEELEDYELKEVDVNKLTSHFQGEVGHLDHERLKQLSIQNARVGSFRNVDADGYPDISGLDLKQHTNSIITDYEKYVDWYCLNVDVGTAVDAFCQIVKRWYPAVVLRKTEGRRGGLVLVKYDQWSTRWNVWLKLLYIAPRHSCVRHYGQSRRQPLAFVDCPSPSRSARPKKKRRRSRKNCIRASQDLKDDVANKQTQEKENPTDSASDVDMQEPSDL